MRAAKDRDLYVEWSTIVNDCTYVGGRREMLAYLAREGSVNAEDRLARADETGISARFFIGSWGDEFLQVGQLGQLARADLAAYVEAESHVEAYRLLRPFEWESERDLEYQIGRALGNATEPRWVRRNVDKPHRCPRCHSVVTWDRCKYGPRTRLVCPYCHVQWRAGKRVYPIRPMEGIR